MCLTTITVSKKLFSKYRKITSAVKAAQPGDTIMIEAGVYQEGVIVDKPITLIGKDKDVVILGNMRTEADVTLQNIKFTTNNAENVNYGLHIQYDTANVQQCEFNKIVGYGIYIDKQAKLEAKSLHISEVIRGIMLEQDASCRIEDSVMMNNEQHGLMMENRSTAYVKRCLLTGHKYPSIFAGNESELTVVESKIQANEHRGVDTEKSKAVFQNCEFFNNEGAQLYFSSESEIALKDCTFQSEKEETHGIYSTESNVTIDHCTVKQHTLPQIMAENSTITLTDSTISNGIGTNGVRMTDHSTLTMARCTVTKHDLIQVTIESNSSAEIKNCTIYDGQQTGVHFENATGVVEHCEIYLNDDQVTLQDGSNVTVRSCQLYESRGNGSGCCAYDGTTLTVQDCEIHHHEAAQIYCQAATVEIERTKVYEGRGNGIRLMKQAEVKMNACEVFNHPDYPQIAIEEQSVIAIKNSQLHGSDYTAVLFEQSFGTLEHCQIYNNGARQLSIKDQSKVQIVQCEVFNGKPETNGLLISGQSSVGIINSVIKEHEYPQIYVEEQSQIHMMKSKVIDGKDSTGIRMISGRGLIDDCEFVNNGEFPHIALEEQSDVTIQNCKIYDGGGIGIAVDQSNAVIDRCELFRNHHTQIDVDNEATAEITQCKIYDGQSHGIRVAARATAHVEDVFVYHHQGELAQVVVKEEANPTFKNCQIYDGAGDGVLIFNNGRGTFEDCAVFNHADANFCIAQQSAPILRRNRIYNGKLGVFVEGANPYIENCVFDNHLYDDLYFDEHCNPELIHNEFTSIRDERPVDPAAMFEQALGFNPFALEPEALRVKLVAENRKWLHRLNAPSAGKRQQAERAIELIDELQKQLLQQN